MSSPSTSTPDPMVSRRWIDPRDRRPWQVSVGPVRRLGGRDRDPVPTVAFQRPGTPKQVLRVGCCARAEASFPGFGDQHLALCLDAARRGGRIWMHPESGELWWIQSDPDGGGRRVHLRSARGEIEVEGGGVSSATELSDRDIVRLVGRRAAGAG